MRELEVASTTCVRAEREFCRVEVEKMQKMETASQPHPLYMAHGAKEETLGKDPNGDSKFVPNSTKWKCSIFFC